MYPNPAGSSLSIYYDFPSLQGKATNGLNPVLGLEIYDFLGRVVYAQQNLQDADITIGIDVSSWQDGVYLYRFTSSGIMKDGKFVVHR